MSTANRTIAITGATGLLGRALCREFARSGWNVRAGVRHPADYQPPAPGVTPFECLLPERIAEAGLRGADVCIHAAYVTRFTNLAEARRVNEDGTRAVLELARRCGVRQFVFLSTCSAHEGARSYYGRSKFLLEQSLDLQRDLVLRPGLVLANGGLFARMCDWVRNSRVVPVFGGGKQLVQTIHIDDFCAAMLRAVELEKTGRIVLAETPATTMRELLEAMAQRLRRRPWFLAVPVTPVLAVLRATEALGLRLPVSSENLLGVLSATYQDPSRAAELGVRIRSFRESIDVLSSGPG